MSGGHFDYKQYHIDDIADEIEHLVKSNNNNEKDEYGDDIGYHYPEDVIERFKEAISTLRRAASMAQRIDWLVSGDSGEDSFRERWKEELDEA